MRSSTTLVLSIAVAAVSAACTGGNNSAAAGASSTPSGAALAMTGRNAGCVDTRALDVDAAAGHIYAGPFTSNQGYWTQPQGTKLWVGSSRAGPPVAAVIKGQRLDGGGEFVQRRGARQRVTVGTLPVFYPGAVRMPSGGQWRLTVTIGPDRGCFLVHVLA